MRVLMLGWEFPPHISGGLGTACEGLTRGLAAHGVKVVFVLPRLAGDETSPHATLRGADEGAGDEDASAEIVPVASALLPYETPSRFRERTARAAAALAEPRYGRDLMGEVARYAAAVAPIAEAERFDLVHGHDWMTYPAAARAAKESGVPLVLHVHSLEHDRAGPRANPRIVEIEQAGFDAADAIVCVSRFTADVLAQRYSVDAAKLRVVHNAGPASSPRRRGARRIREPVVLFLGRVTYQKGPEVFLEAARRVVAVRPEVKFVVAGSGDLYPLLVERAARLGLARHVHFTGFLRGADVERAYALADVFVLPSVSEPFGITPLEAAARGVPVIVSRQSGVIEVLKGALVVDSWDVAGLAERILDVLRSPRLAADLVRRGRRDARRLSWEGQGAKLRGVYADVLR